MQGARGFQQMAGSRSNVYVINFSHPLATLITHNSVENAEMTIQSLIRKGESEIVELKESFGKEITKNLKELGYEV